MSKMEKTVQIIFIAFYRGVMEMVRGTIQEKTPAMQSLDRPAATL